MGNLLDSALNFHHAALKGNVSVSVNYSRVILGVTQSVTLNATIGSTQFEVNSPEGINEQYESRDYLIDPADLVLAAVVRLPVRGDRITEGSNVYEVAGPSDEQPYRFSDDYRKKFRVHTVKVT